jgi:predicted Fe-S protein YdhL (DUF1289 family)
MTRTPCIGICTATALGDAICRGCGRTFEQVRDWNQYSEDRKKEVVEMIKKREGGNGR